MPTLITRISCLQLDPPHLPLICLPASQFHPFFSFCFSKSIMCTATRVTFPKMWLMSLPVYTFSGRGGGGSPLLVGEVQTYSIVFTLHLLSCCAMLLTLAIPNTRQSSGHVTLYSGRCFCLGSTSLRGAMLRVPANLSDVSLPIRVMPPCSVLG